jgi:hypothetical protein
MAINFIQNHIIDKIEKETESILKSEKNTGFIWLQQPIYDKNNFNINKIGKSNPFALKKKFPLNWYALQPKTLLKIYKMIKRNEFFLIHDKKGPYYINVKK